MRLKRLYLFLLLSFPILNLLAVPASPDPITITQADGSVLSVKLQGDEFYHCQTTLDGYLLTPDANGILNYAQQDSLGNIVSTNVKAHDIEKRSAEELLLLQGLNKNINFSNRSMKSRVQRAPSAVSASSSATSTGYPLTGSPKALIILVNFSDLAFVTASPNTAYTNLLNQAGYSDNGGTGSAADYFRDNSMGVLTPQFDVVGPVTLPKTMAYYGTNDAQGLDLYPQQMVIDACTAAHNSGVNFSQYDTDHNGVVDNVFIYYAGHNEAEGGGVTTIWPHKWNLPNHATVFNGVAVYNYACTSELRSSTGTNMCGIGTFCHEFGHVLGLPDYYATNSATHHTLSSWNIMDYGPYLNSGRTPPAYSGYDRFFLNWLVPTEIKDAGNYSLNALNTSNNAYLITQNGNSNLIGNNPNPVEFFTLENRQNTGWDSFLPGHGMLLTHIYYNSSTWIANTVNNDPLAMGVDIIEADGLANSTTLSGDAFPGTANVTFYNPLLRAGTDIGKPITEIVETNGVISFKLKGGLATLDPLTTASAPNHLVVKMEHNGEVLVQFSGAGLGLQYPFLKVYNLLGECVQTVQADGNQYVLSNLPRNQIYILKVNGMTSKLIL
jgi:M6 family metalloprotease-like protein